jgi:glycosyltransferase involved in cell wall biosynthesis
MYAERQLPSTPAKEIHRLLFINPSEKESARELLVMQALAELKCETVSSPRFPQSGLEQFDGVVLRHPQIDPRLLDGIALCKAAQIPVILDLTRDIERMPLDHPDYPALGLSTRTRANAYAATLLLADLICTPGETLAGSLQAEGYRVRIIPNGWSAQNPLWQQPSQRRHILNIGWLGQPGQLDDLLLIRRMLIRVLREFQNTRLIIGGDPRAYQLFDSLPESRRLYLPQASFDDQPYSLSQLDILLVPLRNNPFNHSLSDQPLMEAGVLGIPWIASSIPAFHDWGVGGLLAGDLQEWHSHLRRLVVDPALRRSLGQDGRQRAQSREMSRLAPVWMEMIGSVTPQAQHQLQPLALVVQT